MEININCDLGEKSKHHSNKNDPELLNIVNTASIACGYHAGDENTMREVIGISIKNGVSFGAHPSFKDLENFGRKRIHLSAKEIKKLKTQHNFSFLCPENCPPKGESFLDQCKRVSKFVDNLNFHDHTSLIFISHSGTIRAFLSRILDLDPNKAIGIEISHLSITSIEVLKKDNIINRGGKYRLLSVNNQFI